MNEVGSPIYSYVCSVYNYRFARPLYGQERMEHKSDTLRWRSYSEDMKVMQFNSATERDCNPQLVKQSSLFSHDT